MTGRPRTMLKRVARILERQRKLAEELRELMPKQYSPGPSEGWDYPKNPEEWGDDLMRSWRKAVFEICGIGEYIEDLVFLLELKVEKVEQNARDVAEDTADDPEADVDQPESPADCADCRPGSGIARPSRRSTIGRPLMRTSTARCILACNSQPVPSAVKRNQKAGLQ